MIFPSHVYIMVGISLDMITIIRIQSPGKKLRCWLQPTLDLIIIKKKKKRRRSRSILRIYIFVKVFEANALVKEDDLM